MLHRRDAEDAERKDFSLAIERSARKKLSNPFFDLICNCQSLIRMNP